MSAQSWRAIYERLTERLRSVPLDDVEERTKIEQELNRIAPKIDQFIMLPKKRCPECGAQMMSSMRKPWWWCLDNPDHWDMKKSFSPDPRLTYAEWQEIGPRLAETFGCVVTQITCDDCHAPIIEKGIAFRGYRHHDGAQNVYAFDALLIDLNVKGNAVFGSRRGRRLKGVDAWPMTCADCRSRTIS